MAHQARLHHVSHDSLPAIHSVATDNPWQWLAAGWNDFVMAPAISLAYGAIVALVMWLAFYVLQTSEYYLSALGLVAGFALIGPFFAVGLYEISHRLEQRQHVTLSDTWRGWRRNPRSILAFGAILLLMLLAWFSFSYQATALLYGITGDVGPPISATVDWQAFSLSIRMPMVLAFGLIGLIAVAITFVMAVVSVPMLIDREEMDVITAIVISTRTASKNPAALGLWAGLIAIFTGVAVAPLFLGLIVVFPLLAYASWHAYRDLIEH